METQITEMRGSSTLLIISGLLIDFVNPFSGLGVELAAQIERFDHLQYHWAAETKVC